MSRDPAIRHLVDVIDAYLARFDGPDIAGVRKGIADHRQSPLPPVTPARIDPVGHVDTALEAMRAGGESTLAEAIAPAMPFLEWGAYNPYPIDEIGADFADNHAATSLIGTGGQLKSEDFDLGLFVFAPHTLYRDHHHAAPELYAPLTGPNGWRFAPGQPLEWKPAHRPVWNTPWKQHAIKSGALPFFAVYAWTRDSAVPARMIVEPDWAELEAAPAP